MLDINIICSCYFNPWKGYGLSSAMGFEVFHRSCLGNHHQGVRRQQGSPQDGQRLTEVPALQSGQGVPTLSEPSGMSKDHSNPGAGNMGQALEQKHRSLGLRGLPPSSCLLH